MEPKKPLHFETSKVVDRVRNYLEKRLQRESVTSLNELVRELRVFLQEVLISSFLPLQMEEARKFRLNLGDRLFSVCNELNGKSHCTKEDQRYHGYCIQEVLSCFEWAEQIKEELPEDLITQQVLALDIPILRPFDYGLEKKPVPKPSKRS